MDRDTVVLLAYAGGFYVDCEECGERVISALNGVYLDPDATVDGDWSISMLGEHSKPLAMAGGPRGTESRFDLHAHQPPEGGS